MLIKNLLKQIYQKKIFIKTTALILFFAFSSCTDQGCIDADDFGEYESQTVEVLANSSQDACTYDATKTLSDSTQGSGIKACLITGTATVIDENNVTKTSTPANSGCNGFKDGSGVVDAKFTNLCIQQCVQACLSNAGVNATSSEPNWISTDKKSGSRNIGVTVRSGSQIIMRAVGSVKLGDSVTYPDVFVQGDNPLPHSKKINWGSAGNDAIFDIRNGQTLDVKFSGRWGDGSTTIGAGTSTTLDEKAFNGARRIVAYLIPHPSGYDFDYTQSDEKAGSKTVPLLPDPAAWECTYTGADVTQSACGTKTNGYTAIGYTNVNDSLAGTTFQVTSAFKSTGLTQYGGIIRWAGDELQPESSFDPFATSSCDNSGSCTNINGISADTGRILGNASSGIEITNSYTTAFKVAFKSLNATCNNFTLETTIKDSSNNVLFDFTSGAVPPNPVTVTNSGWSTQHITLEPGQKLSIAALSSNTGSGANCGLVTAVKFNKYHDLTMEKSGFVSFAMLGQVGASGNCNIKGRVVNPSGSLLDFSSFTKDFYEYDDFTTAISVDPLANLSVPTYTGSSSWSNRVFVRKGQKIRFSPESWNGNWNSPLSRQCGVGMAMRLEPRPALICRGAASDKIMNPDCLLDYDNNATLLGCKSNEPRCDDSGNATYYCTADCRHVINNCEPGTSGNNYAKTASGSNTCDKSATLVGACSSYAPGSNSGTCNACGDQMVTNVRRAAKIDMASMKQCYDLESYTGKVSNIPAATGFSQAQLDDATIAKGAFKLGNFNGEYGNLEGFSAVGSTDSFSNQIFQVKSPVIFSRAGRLRFFMLDSVTNSDFRDLETAYSNNTPISGASYGGSNGFRISSSSMLEFSNGQWLQARLCKESSNSDTTPSVDCKTSNPTALANQPLIIEITPPLITDPPGTPPNISSGYKFDSYGNLIRTAGASAYTGDCVDSAQNAIFYCHTYKYYSDTDYRALPHSPSVNGAGDNQESVTDELQKLRITFKIFDPEIANCNTTDPTSVDYTTNGGIKLKNPFYDSTAGGATGATCDPRSPANESPASPAPSGKVTCHKEFYCANKYSNNSGKYFVNIKVKSPVSGNVSSIIGSVVKPVVEVMDGPKDGSKMGQAERMYKLLIADPRYKAIVTMCLVLMVTFYGFGYLIGVIDNITSSELISRIVKISIIYLFIGENGWDWFNKFAVKFFKDGTDYLAFMMASSFDSSPEVADAIAHSDYYDKSILFSSVDKVFSMFFSQAVQKKISALLFASIFGWAYLLIIYQSFLLYVYAVANAVLIYLTAQVFLSILFTLGPIFFIFTLFEKTKEMFDNWLKQIISFSLQQIFLLTTLAFFNMMMYEVIKLSLGYKICWDEVWTINIITRITLLSFWTIASLPPRTNAQSSVGNIGNPDGIPSLFSILFIWVIASLMNKFVGFMTDLASGMAGGLSATKLGDGVSALAKQLKGAASKQMGELWKKTGGQAVQRLDKALFDSGALADKEREIRKKQNAQNAKLKSALSDAGKKGMSDYKKKNASELAGMSKEKQVEALTKAKNDAMMAEGKKRGLSEDEVKKLQQDKGFKYEGSNVFGAAAQALKQSATSGGTLRKSLDDQKVSSKFSNSEAKAALKGMNQQQRKEFIDAAKKGAVEIGKSKYAAVKSAPKDAAQAISGGAKAAAAGVKKAILHPMRSAKDAAGYTKDYAAARSQLEAEGKITRMKDGTGWSRSDAEKKAIRDRMKKNADEKKVDKASNKATAVTELEREANYLADRESIDPKTQRFGDVISNRINAEVRRHAVGGKEKAALKKGAQVAIKGKLKENLKAALGVQGDADFHGTGAYRDKEDKEAMGEVARKDLASLDSADTAMFDKMRQDEAKQGIFTKAGRQARADLNAARKTLAADPEKQKAYDKYQKAHAAINKSDAEVANAQERIDTLERDLQDIDAAEGAYDKALAIVDPEEYKDAAFSGDHAPQRETISKELTSAKETKAALEARPQAATPEAQKKQAAEVRAATAAVAKLERTAAAMDQSEAIYKQAQETYDSSPIGSTEREEAAEIITEYKGLNSDEAFESFAAEYSRDAEASVAAFEAIDSVEDYQSYAKKHGGK